MTSPFPFLPLSSSLSSADSGYTVDVTAHSHVGDGDIASRFVIIYRRVSSGEVLHMCIAESTDPCKSLAASFGTFLAKRTPDQTSGIDDAGWPSSIVDLVRAGKADLTWQ